MTITLQSKQFQHFIKTFNTALTNRKRNLKSKSCHLYIWCLHCEKAFKEDKWYDSAKHDPEFGTWGYDPYFEKSGECPECGAGEFTDGWEWSRVAKINSYPAIPEEGKYYPLYGEIITNQKEEESRRSIPHLNKIPRLLQFPTQKWPLFPPKASKRLMTKTDTHTEL